jgi:hypothetical protein
VLALPRFEAFAEVINVASNSGYLDCGDAGSKPIPGNVGAAGQRGKAWTRNTAAGH